MSICGILCRGKVTFHDKVKRLHKLHFMIGNERVVMQAFELRSDVIVTTYVFFITYPCTHITSRNGAYKVYGAHTGEAETLLFRNMLFKLRSDQSEQ